MNQKRMEALAVAQEIKKENNTLYGGSHPALLKAIAMIEDLAALPSPLEVRVTALTDAAQLAALTTQDPQKRTDYSTGWNAAAEAISGTLYRHAAIDAKMA